MLNTSENASGWILVFNLSCVSFTWMWMFTCEHPHTCSFMQSGGTCSCCHATRREFLCLLQCFPPSLQQSNSMLACWLLLVEGMKLSEMQPGLSPFASASILIAATHLCPAQYEPFRYQAGHLVLNDSRAFGAFKFTSIICSRVTSYTK